MFLEIDEDFSLRKLGDFVVIQDRSIRNESEITKEKAKEIIEFLTKFVEGE